MFFFVTLLYASSLDEKLNLQVLEGLSKQDNRNKKRAAL